jgi:copper chaperone CopZ
LQLSGLADYSSAHRIESQLIAHEGVKSASVSLAVSTATIEFELSLVGPRDLIQLIEVGNVGCFRLLLSLFIRFV